MEQRDYLSMVVDGILEDALKRQHNAATKISIDRHVPGKDRIVGFEQYGVVDFTIRLISHMRLMHDIRWAPMHRYYRINDFTFMVNTQGKLRTMQDEAKTLECYQMPHKRSKMVPVIAREWQLFWDDMQNTLPDDRRYYQLSLIAIYARQLLKRLSDTAQIHLRSRIPDGKESLLPCVVRYCGIAGAQVHLKHARERTMEIYEDAATHFKDS